MKRLKAYFKSLKDYRHWIMIAFIALSVALIPFFFQYAHLRLWESLVAFGNSCKYWFSELFSLNLHGKITVNEFTEQPFDLPLNLPRTWEEFAVNMSGYWSRFFSQENFAAYMGKVADGLFVVTQIIAIIAPIFLIWFIVSILVKPKQNTKHAQETKALKRFKRFEIKVCKPIRDWFKDFFGFVRDNAYYLKILAWIWAYSFNIISIVVSLFAYFFYFIMALKTPTIYIQLVKILMDLSVMFNFIADWIWAIIIIVLLSLISRKIGYNRLNHHERCNRGFINERGVSTVIDGPMDSGKTQAITDMSLSAEVQERDMALDVILDCDFHFPNFPWIRLELFLKKMFEKHIIYDKWSCCRVIKFLYACFCAGLKGTAMRKSCRRNLKKRYGINYNNLLFDYDYERYGLTYNNGLEDIPVWQDLEDYACAYLIYTRRCSLILANYSIRSDNIMSDIGNFPLWNTDFFKRDSKLLESSSQYSHILNYNMLRFGKVTDEDDPLRYAFGFGVYTISEIDKERQNSPKLKSKKDNLPECNQQNDLFDLNIMMSRHAVNIHHKCFLKIFSDLQRFEELGISTLGLGEKISIEKKSERTPVLPFFSPFWLFDLVAGFIVHCFENHYLTKRFDRGDYTLPGYLMKNIAAKLRSHRERVNNVFGCSVLTLSVEQGRNNSEPLKRKYYIQSKKIWAQRYSTDCLSGIYAARGKLNKVGIDEIETYAGIMATDEELLKQNSFFQRDVHNVVKP